MRGSRSFGRRARQVAAGTREPFYEDATVAGIHVRISSRSRSRRHRDPDREAAGRGRQHADRLALFPRRGVSAGSGSPRSRAARLAHAFAGPAHDGDRGARDRDDATFGQQDRSRAGDELGRLADSFNSMLSALDDSLRAHDAADRGRLARAPPAADEPAHERRGPPARDELPEDERARILAEIRCQAEELTELLGDLLDLSRPSVQPEPGAARGGGRAAIDRTSQLQRIGFNTSLEPTTIDGVPSRLERAVANLLGERGQVEPLRRPGRRRAPGRRARCETWPRDRPRGPRPRVRPLLPRHASAPCRARGSAWRSFGRSSRSTAARLSAENAPDGGARFRVRFSPAPLGPPQAPSQERALHFKCLTPPDAAPRGAAESGGRLRGAESMVRPPWQLQTP